LPISLPYHFEHQRSNIKTVFQKEVRGSTVRHSTKNACFYTIFSWELLKNVVSVCKYTPYLVFLSQICTANEIKAVRAAIYIFDVFIIDFFFLGLESLCSLGVQNFAFGKLA